MERLDVFLSDIKLSSGTPATGVFSGYGAVFGNIDATGDMIQKGAFATSLAEWKSLGKLPPMLLQHGGGMFGSSPDGLLPVGKWTSMEENAKGLRVEGFLFAQETERGKYIYEGLKAGELDGLSIGFRTRKYQLGTRAGEPDRTLTDIDLREVSIVTFPANPKARITGVKTLAPTELREIEEYLRDEGLSRKAATRAVSFLNQMLFRDERGLPGSALRDEVAPGSVGGACEAMEAADRLLSGVLGGLLKY